MQSLPVITEHFHHLKETPYQLAVMHYFPHFLPPSSLSNGQNLLSEAMDLPILDILYKMDHIIYVFVLGVFPLT